MKKMQPKQITALRRLYQRLSYREFNRHLNEVVSLEGFERQYQPACPHRWKRRLGRPDRIVCIHCGATK
jgi:hypothetical protein